MARYSQDWRRVEELKEDVILVSTGGRGATYIIQYTGGRGATLYTIQYKQEWKYHENKKGPQPKGIAC